MTERPRAVNLDKHIETREGPSGSVIASLAPLGLEAAGVNEDDAKAALQQVFVSFIKDGANADAVKEFFAAYGEESTIPNMDPKAAANLAVAAKEAEATFESLTGDMFDDWVADKMALIDFTADWCGPCKILAPVLREVAEHLGIPVGRVDADVSKDLVERFAINGYPTVLLLRQGNELERLVGAGREREALVEILQGHLRNE